MTDYHEKVRELARMTGGTLPEAPEMPNEAERVLRCRMLLEETLEYIRASGCKVLHWSDGRTTVEARPDLCEADLAAMAHENADVLYIAFGNAVAMGVDTGPVFEAVHAANLSKAMPDGTVCKRSDGKVLKPPGWKPADVASVLRAQDKKP